jgi:hypothetical protein
MMSILNEEIDDDDVRDSFYIQNNFYSESYSDHNDFFKISTIDLIEYEDWETKEFKRKTLYEKHAITDEFKQTSIRQRPRRDVQIEQKELLMAATLRASTTLEVILGYEHYVENEVFYGVVFYNEPNGAHATVEVPDVQQFRNKAADLLAQKIITILRDQNES